MKKQKKKIILLLMLLVIAIALVIVAINFNPKSGGKNTEQSTLRKQNKVTETDKKKEENKKTDDNDIVTEKEITQKSDSKGENPPVEVNTDGTVNVDKLEGYEEDNKKDEKVSESRIHIKSIGSYSGPYVEDGSDEEVENVLAIVVTNTSEQFLQYSEITMKNGDQKAKFSLSNLPAGASAVVLAKERNQAGADWTYADDTTAFIDKAEQHEDKFSWEAGDGLVVLNNKSQKKYSKVHVYYKNTVDGVYLGGITYRIAFDNMQVGEARAKLSKHFDGNNSHVMMIDYID